MKFHHLNSLLEGKVAATIGGSSVSGSIYKAAIKLLESRYGQDNAIASHIEKLYNLLSKIWILKGYETCSTK